jgi:hypothetical protein
MDAAEAYIYSIDLLANEPIEWRRLPRLLAEALHQAPFPRTAAAVSFESELMDDITGGRLPARNPFTLARYPTDIPEFIEQSVILPRDLAPILAERGIRLVLVPADAKTGAKTTETAAADRQLKRAALVASHERDWPTIDRDLRDAHTNGLHEAAHAGTRGYWNEQAALGWAQARNKLRARTGVHSGKAASPWGTLGD